MKKLIIFDLDGTLADTQPLLNFIFADALTECGFPETEEHIRELVKEIGYRPTKDGGHAPTAYFDRIPDNFGFYFWTHYENYYMKAADRLYDCIREMLTELKARGHKIAVFSNKPHRFTERIINKAFGEGYFDFILGGTPEIAPKPAPTGITYICKMLGIKTEDAYMIGDLPADAASAVSANSNFIGALWGYSTREKLAEKGGTIFAERPIELLDIIG
jgi:phosphoglycolate phosphatase